MAINSRQIRYLLPKFDLPKITLALAVSLAIALWHLWSNSLCDNQNCGDQVVHSTTTNTIPEAAALEQITALSPATQVLNSQLASEKAHTGTAKEPKNNTARGSQDTEKAIQELELLISKLELEIEKGKEGEDTPANEFDASVETQFTALSVSAPQPRTIPANSDGFAEIDGPAFGERTTIRVPVKVSTWDIEASDTGATSSLEDDLQVLPDYHQTISLPSCDAINAIRINRSSQLNKFAIANFQVICFEPGDYRNAGSIQIDNSGSESEPKVFRSTIDSNDSHVLETNEQALLPALDFQGSSHWIVDGLSWTGSAEAAISIDGGSDIFLSRNRFRDVEQALAISGETVDVQFQNNWVQAHEDHNGTCAAVLSNDTSRELGIVGNQFDDCANAVKLETQTGSLSLVVADNDFYQDNNSSCDIKGLYTNVGGKSSAPNSIIGNRFYGWKSDTDCVDTSAAIEIARKNRYMRIEKNLFEDVQTAIEVSTGVQELRIENNLIANSAKNNALVNAAALVIAGKTESLSIIGNHMVDSGRWLYLQDSQIDLRCNVILDGSEAHGMTLIGGLVDDNTYFNTNPSVASAPNGSDQLYADSSWANMSRLCTDVRQISGNRELCIDDALSSNASPQRCGSVYWRDSSR